METLRRGAKRLRFPLRAGTASRPSSVYLEELEAARPRLRLTALTDPEAVQRRHFLEPLALLAAAGAPGRPGHGRDRHRQRRGVPGPADQDRPAGAAAHPAGGERQARRLPERAGARLGLENVTVVNRRAEEAARDSDHREAYDLALARAVAPLPVLVELALPFLRVGGVLAAPKGSAARRRDNGSGGRPGGLRRRSGIRWRAGGPGNGDAPDACCGSEEVAHAGTVSPPAGYTCQASFALIDKKLTGAQTARSIASAWRGRGPEPQRQATKGDVR